MPKRRKDWPASRSFAKRRLVVFGGSFNPPGVHHRQIVELLARRFHQVKIMPCGHRPDKPSSGLVSNQDRIRMCQQAFRGIHGASIMLYDLRGGPEFTRTFNVDQLLKLNYHFDYWHAVGLDAFLPDEHGQIPIRDRWYNGSSLWECTHFVILTRGGKLPRRDQLPRHHIIIPCDIPCSSSEIRRRLAVGESITGLVDPHVEEYILQNHLYQNQGAMSM